MARVISEKPIGEVTYVCSNCHYEIGYHPGDIVSGRDEDDGTSYRYVVCPKCGKSKDLSPKGHGYEDDTY